MSLIDPCRESMVLLDGHAAKQSSKYIYVYNHRLMLLSIMVRETVFFSFQSPKHCIFIIFLYQKFITEEGVERILEPEDRELYWEMLSSGYGVAIGLMN